jgi:hypothetical protein
MAPGGHSSSSKAHKSTPSSSAAHLTSAYGGGIKARPLQLSHTFVLQDLSHYYAADFPIRPLFGGSEKPLPQLTRCDLLPRGTPGAISPNSLNRYIRQLHFPWDGGYRIPIPVCYTAGCERRPRGSPQGHRVCGSS